MMALLTKYGAVRSVRNVSEETRLEWARTTSLITKCKHPS